MDMNRSTVHDYMKEIRESLASGDFSSISRAAHTIKSSYSNIGALSSVQLAKEIEILAKNSLPNAVEIQSLVVKLEAELQKAEQAIAAQMGAQPQLKAGP